MGSQGKSIPAPAGAKDLAFMSLESYAALRLLAVTPHTLPTAGAVGYRSFAALRLFLMTQEIIDSAQSLN